MKFFWGYIVENVRTIIAEKNINFEFIDYIFLLNFQYI